MADPSNERLPDHDPMLRMWVDTANEKALEIGLTLQVGGLLVSGLLIGYDAYYIAVGEQFASSFPGTADVWRDAFNPENRPKREEPQQSAAHIHMRNVRLFQPGVGPIPSAGGVVWRGRLTAVDAWWFGELIFSVDR